MEFSIYDLNLDLTNTPKDLYIKFYYFYFDESMFIEEFFLITKKIDIIKKNVSCELTNFKDSIEPEESLIFDARFYDALNYSNLVGKNITFTTKVDNMTVYQDSYLTNSSGMIHLNLTVNEELSLGHNYLIFKLKNDDIYNNSIFIYEVIVGKIPVYTDIIEFKDEVEYSEEIEILLYYYDLFNNPLQNETIKISLYGEDHLLFENETKTNELGILSMNLTLEFYNKYQEYELSFIFNGTTSLRNSTLILNISIIQEPVNQKTHEPNIVLPVSIGIVIVAAILIIYYMKKKKKPMSLADMTFNH